jgi:hypothetical protein
MVQPRSASYSIREQNGWHFSPKNRNCHVPARNLHHLHQSKELNWVNKEHGKCVKSTEEIKLKVCSSSSQ